MPRRRRPPHGTPQRRSCGRLNFGANERQEGNSRPPNNQRSGLNSPTSIPARSSALKPYLRSHGLAICGTDPSGDGRQKLMNRPRMGRAMVLMIGPRSAILPAAEVRYAYQGSSRSSPSRPVVCSSWEWTREVVEPCSRLSPKRSRRGPRSERRGLKWSSCFQSPRRSPRATGIPLSRAGSLGLRPTLRQREPRRRLLNLRSPLSRDRCAASAAGSRNRNPPAAS